MDEWLQTSPDAYEGQWIIAERYVDQWKPLPLDTGKGLGILVFTASYKASTFIQANWEHLGPSWQPLKLRYDQLAYVLERYADEEATNWVVYDAPAIRAAPEQKVDLELADIREIISLLRD